MPSTYDENHWIANSDYVLNAASMPPRACLRRP